MKNTKAIHILFFSFLMFSSLCTRGQEYLLTTRGDSIAGEIKPLLYGPEKKVQVISADDRSKTTYSIFQVRAFSSEGDVYHPVKNESGYVFMKLLKEGYLSLYAYQMENQTRFDGLFLRKADGDNLAVPNLGFKKYITKFLEDCPAVTERVKVGELGKKDLPELVDAYNACVANRTVDHTKILTQRGVQSARIGAWETLEKKIREMDFSEKSNALEMVDEIRKKIERQESIPNFLVEGLKNSLKDTGLNEELEQAMQQIN